MSLRIAYRYNPDGGYSVHQLGPHKYAWPVIQAGQVGSRPTLRVGAPHLVQPVAETVEAALSPTGLNTSGGGTHLLCIQETGRVPPSVYNTTTILTVFHLITGTLSGAQRATRTSRTSRAGLNGERHTAGETGAGGAPSGGRRNQRSRLFMNGRRPS